MKTEYQSDDSAFLGQAKPPFQQSPEEAWDQLLSKIEEGVPIKPLRSSKTYWRRAIAATILLLCLCSFAASRYTLTHQVPFANQDTIFLPDSSKLILRAGSTITYKPLWWYLSREVVFEGEAYFKVKKGSQFSVSSQRGNTKVLGTQFHIKTFAERYEVYCQEGRVGVRVATLTDELDLAAGERLVLQADTLLKSAANDSQILAWMGNQFYFESTPLAEALAEIERSYAIEIQYIAAIQSLQLLTAAFEKREDPKETLEIIGEVFALELHQSGPSRFVLTPQAP